MGKVDWNSPEMRLLFDLQEDWEPPEYATALLGSRAEAFVFIRALVGAGLLYIRRADCELSEAELHAAMASPESLFNPADLFMSLSSKADAALRNADMKTIAASLAGRYSRQ